MFPVVSFVIADVTSQVRRQIVLHTQTCNSKASVTKAVLRACNDTMSCRKTIAGSQQTAITVVAEVDVVGYCIVHHWYIAYCDKFLLPVKRGEFSHDVDAHM